MDNRTQIETATPQNATGSANQELEGQQEKPLTEADHLYTMLKPLHNLPRGKNTWDPKFIKIWWFWPASVAFLLVMYYVYPYIWNFFAGP